MVYSSPNMGGMNLSWDTLMRMDLDERDIVEEALQYLREKEAEVNEAALEEARRNAGR